MSQATASASPSATWCVRFLNGPLRGRTIALKHGTNVVGSGSDCDILLQGDVLPRHLVFTVGDIAVSIQKQGTAQVRLNGDELSMQRRSAVRGDIISVGTVDFELDKLSVEGQADSAVEGRADADLDEPAALAMSTASPATTARAKTALPYRQALIVGGVIVLATVSIVMGLHSYEPGGHTWTAISPTTDIESLHRLVADYPEVKVIDHADGKVGVRGFVESRTRRATLIETLRRFGDNVSVNVHAADDLAEQARRYLNEPDLSVDYAGQGRLVVSGVTTNEAVHDKVSRLGADLRSVVAVVDEVESERSKSSPLKNRSDLSEWQGSLPAQMVGLTEMPNGMRHIQLSNGKRYYEGSTLKSGDELVNIEADHLVVTNTKKSRANGYTEKEEAQ